MHPKVCRDHTIKYSHKGSPLSFFVPLNGTNTTLLNITSSSHGEFTAQESGIFLMRFNIVMIDHDKNRSVGVFVDDTPVMACPPGGYQKPKEKLDNHRICSFNGILQMNKGDKLQLRTMEDNTTVRIESKDKAFIKVTLLHRMSQGVIPK
ncbi:unnamed protein product [Lymnaea stagnalis]|uniref:Uncharacterized protein n=1 Tax=Lymnaea stagnalis TaxID=6523 RepID=A0AAV2H9D4_LYMST